MLHGNRHRRSKSSVAHIELESLESRLLLSDVQYATVFKEVDNTQASSGAPVAASYKPYQFHAIVVETAAGSVSDASVQETSPAAGSVLSLTEQTSSIPRYDSGGSAKFTAKSAMDAAFPAGSYNLSLDGVNDGPHTLALDLTSSDDYPSAPPQITNYDALQAADPTKAITITWNAFAGGTTGDLIMASVYDSQGNNLVSSLPGQANQLNGTATSITIPAGTLSAGTTYGATVYFFKVTGTDTTDYPGVVGYAGYAEQTDFTFDTTSAASSASINATAPPPQTVAAGQSNSIALGSFSETGTTGPYSVDVSWDDGSPDTNFAQASPGPITAQSHTFADAAVDSVSVTITDANGDTSNAADFNVTVLPASSAAMVALNASVNPAPSGAEVTFTATVIGTGPAPSGTVTFYDGSTVLSSSVEISGGIATLQTSSLHGGVNSITAEYNGDSDYALSTSPVLDETVADVSTSLVGTVPASVVAGTPLKLKDKLTLGAGSTPVTGKSSASILLSPDESAADSVLTLASSSDKLKLKADKAASFNLRFPKSIPANFAAGTYHILIELTDTTGAVSTMDSGQSLTVVAPVVDLSGLFVKVPASVKAGKKFAATFLVTNLSDANVPAVGFLPIDIETSPDGQLSDATLLEPLKQRINLKPGKSVKITLHATVSATTGLVVVLDPQHTFGDNSNAANNVFSQQIVVA